MQVMVKGLVRSRPIGDRSADRSALVRKIMQDGGIADRIWRWLARVSLSDWLAFQARNRGSKDPRLLRDRPTDGLHRCAKTGVSFGVPVRLCWFRRVSQAEYGEGACGPVLLGTVLRIGLHWFAKIYAGGACKVLRELG